MDALRFDSGPVQGDANTEPALRTDSKHALLKLMKQLKTANSDLTGRFLLHRALKHVVNIKPALHCEAILQMACEIARYHPQLVEPFLSASAALPPAWDVFHLLSRLTLDLARIDTRTAADLLYQTPSAVRAFNSESFLEWGRLALNRMQDDPRTAPAIKVYLRESPGKPELSRWMLILDQAARVVKHSAAAGEAMCRFAFSLCRQMDAAQFRQWVDAGLTLSKSPKELADFFNGTSKSSVEARKRLETNEFLKKRVHLLSLICEANLGRSVQIQSNTALDGISEFNGGAATDGKTIYLPDSARDFGTYKLMALHQSMIPDTIEALRNTGGPLPEPSQLHRITDGRLLHRFPKLRQEMARQNAGDLNAAYPFDPQASPRPALPWWGDILPNLIQETQATIKRMQQKAAAHIGSSPDVVEGIVAGLMARGQRDDQSLWNVLRCILNTSETGASECLEPPADAEVFYYDEWDPVLSAYKKDWVRVLQRTSPSDPNAFSQDVVSRLSGLIGLIKKRFMRLKPAGFQKLRAQPDGDHLDIDALTQAYADMRAGSFLSENVYIRRDKTRRSVAALFLLDISGSTDEIVGGRRVIDIQREAVFLMSEALTAIGDQYAIFGFHSEGRFQVNLQSVKEFTEPGGTLTGRRLGNLTPDGLTRMGAAIRHATYKLRQTAAATKLLIILTDGRPYDLDYGDLDHAVVDTKKAVDEARRSNIHPFIITSDAEGAGYLSRITRFTQSIILPRIELLPSMLPAIYKRLTC